MTALPPTAHSQSANPLSALFERLTRLKVGVIGDFAIDLYFNYQTRTGEQSIETGLTVHWGSQPRASLGAAGNVVQNLLAMGVGEVAVVGCVGPDLFGREMRHLFESQGVKTDYLLTANTGWDTCVYTKPMQGESEANRIDFGTHNTLSDAQFGELLTGLERLLPQLDVLIVNQQFPCSLLTPDRIGSINTLIQQYPSVRFLADLRQTGLLIRGATLKVNTDELARFRQISVPANPHVDWCVEQASLLSKTVQGPVVVTRGEAGMVYVDGPTVCAVDGLALTGPLDTVGAGDTVVAALAASLSAGATPQQALMVANLAAAVTVQKIGQTGTATPAEINQLFSSYTPA